MVVEIPVVAVATGAGKDQNKRRRDRVEELIDKMSPAGVRKAREWRRKHKGPMPINVAHNILEKHPGNLDGGGGNGGGGGNSGGSSGDKPKVKPGTYWPDRTMGISRKEDKNGHRGARPSGWRPYSLDTHGGGSGGSGGSGSGSSGGSGGGSGSGSSGGSGSRPNNTDGKLDRIGDLLENIGKGGLPIKDWSGICRGYESLAGLTRRQAEIQQAYGPLLGQRRRIEWRQ